MSADTCHVLLVEDRVPDARLIREMLATASHTRFNIRVATCLADAVQLLRDSPQAADIVLLDLSLPDSRGLGSMTTIQQTAPNVPIVVLTSTDDERLAVAAVRAGAQDWLTKTHVTTQLLERALRYAIERHELQQELKRSERQIAELTVTEQRRIGQELHDSLGQQLTGIGFLAKTLERKLEAAESAAVVTAADLEQNVRIAQRHLRRLVKGLLPVEVDADGLMGALDQLARTTERLSNVVCTFQCERRVAVDDNHTATHLFHIVQEAVHNAVQHSGARHIAIRIAQQGNSLLLQVDDDGAGFADAAKTNNGMGLRIMNHRATVVGAALEIGSGDEGGTSVVCTLLQDDGHVATTN